MAGRREVRQAAFLLSFEKMFLDDDLDKIFESAEELGEFIPVNDEVKTLVRSIFDKQEELDSIISKYSDKRAVSRIPKVDLTALRLAIYEALYDEKVPVNVAISEAVALTEKYALEPDIAFVNGLLGSFAKDIKKDED
ncbi:transcription antitermination factor NusB [Ruminococcus albus]|uniref:Transcription antitermination protein NusB n=1 Tax=Ruminococcus albus SY3 TaxID=1341156 RepID=A0A011UX42_RUMAL|nr:transcription antitermination factor NusB [Ruminococcus albus]EXM37782.1 transcription termination factor NusB [Ruminococcus albus SY3]MBE6868479.1 transcription antitermination factor NusB [Ruminococcus albus]MBP5269027.1 transcription antitermination factor NusB [Ruminococcus sp.]